MMKWTSGTLSFSSPTSERIAKKILLAQIKANYSSGDDLTSDEDTQDEEEDSVSAADEGVKEDRIDGDDDGKWWVQNSKMNHLAWKASMHLLVQTAM